MKGGQKKNIEDSDIKSEYISHECLRLLHILLHTPRPQQFFATDAQPSLDHLDPAILDGRPGDDSPNLSEVAVKYLGYLDMATNATQESFID